MEQHNAPTTDTERQAPVAIDATGHAPAPIVEAVLVDDAEEEFLILNAYALMEPR
jgi:hypothetical protein